MSEYSIKRVCISFRPNWACNEEERRSQRNFQACLKRNFAKSENFPNLFYDTALCKEDVLSVRDFIEKRKPLAGVTEILVVEESAFENRFVIVPNL